MVDSGSGLSVPLRLRLPIESLLAEGTGQQDRFPCSPQADAVAVISWTGLIDDTGKRH